jgi:predicted extracellular nuclease
MKVTVHLSRLITIVIGLALMISLLPTQIAAADSPTVFINEIHYDNVGTDAGEAIEVAGPAGTDLTDWSLVLYNGSNGTSYNTTSLSGTIPDFGGGYGVVFVSYAVNGIQNGAPDGMALVDDASNVIQFLSYEGTFIATDGPANGMTSTDIGVAESGTTPEGDSLQLTGIGTSYADFTWATEAPNTFGAVNTDQTFVVLNPFINEIHYDNIDVDTGEAIEVAGPAGTDLTDWSLVLYNGSNGTSYNTTSLSGTIPDLGDGYGVVVVNYPSNGIQNGAPDGMALVDDASNVIQFLSYEGTFMATDGPANGMTSTDIGVAESGTTPVGDSLQLTGTGLFYDDFTWATEAPNTFGAVNTDQIFGISVNPKGTGLATPNLVSIGESTLLTVAVTPGENPTSTGLGVSCDLSTIGGSAIQLFYDDGSNGDVTPDDNTFSFEAAPTVDTSVSSNNLPCTISDAEARTGTASIGLDVIVPIGTVQGSVGNSDNGATFPSPLVGQTVTVQGVIYEKLISRASSGDSTYAFFIQNTSATADVDPNSSDGIYVYIGYYETLRMQGGGYYTPMVGDEIKLQGPVSEYYNLTELYNPYLLSVIRSGVDINAEIPLFDVNPPVDLADANRYWERYEGMRGLIPADSTVLNGRNTFASTADAEVWVAHPDSEIALRSAPYTNRAFRDAHPLDDNYDPANWDGNGYRILMGSQGIKAAENDNTAMIAPARTFDKLANAVSGGLYYGYSKYTIQVDQQVSFSEGVDPALNAPPDTYNRAIHYTIADYNLENLYDYRNNPFSGCDFAGDTGCPQVYPFLAGITPPFDYVPASNIDYQARLNDIAHQIINDLHSPDILMVQEVENQDICVVSAGTLSCGTTDNADGKPDVLQELALKITANGGPNYDAAFDRDSSDLRGIAPAFLYRTDRVELLPPEGDPILGATPIIGDYTAVPYDSDVSNPKTLNAEYDGAGACETAWIFPRAPGIALFRVYNNSIGLGSFRDVYVINNHFKSGPDSCVDHRTEQANYNAALVAYIQESNPDANIVVGGDLNVYPRPDDPFAPIGDPSSSDQLGALYDPTLELKNLWEVLLAEEPQAAYSYVYQGMAQTLDQLFVSQSMLSNLEEFRIAHINSDFPADYSGDVARGTSDHDPNVATFIINDPPTVDTGGPYHVDIGGTVLLTATGIDPEQGPLVYAWDLDNNGTFETPGQNVYFDASLLTVPSQYTVKVQVMDIGGLTAVDETVVYVMGKWFLPLIAHAP